MLEGITQRLRLLVPRRPAGRATNRPPQAHYGWQIPIDPTVLWPRVKAASKVLRPFATAVKNLGAIVSVRAAVRVRRWVGTLVVIKRRQLDLAVPVVAGEALPCTVTVGFSLETSMRSTSPKLRSDQHAEHASSVQPRCIASAGMRQCSHTMSTGPHPKSAASLRASRLPPRRSCQVSCRW